MPTVTKTWVFLSDTEGLAAELANAIVFDWVSNDGDPANGCVEFDLPFGHPPPLPPSQQLARRPATGQTWETWGVPPGAIVTGVQILSLYEKVNASAPSNTSTCDYRVVDSAGARVTASDLATVSPVVDAMWHRYSGFGAQAVKAADQASTTDVRLEIECDLTTGSGSYGINTRIDSIALQITYVGGGGGPGGGRRRPWIAEF